MRRPFASAKHASIQPAGESRLVTPAGAHGRETVRARSTAVKQHEAQLPRERGGNAGMLLLGLAMAGCGGYFFLKHLRVVGRSWELGGTGGFFVATIPLLVGLSLLLFTRLSMLGRLLTVAGLLVLLVSAVGHLRIVFRSSSMFELLALLLLVVAGTLLVARSVRNG